MADIQRPISPHIQIYRWQITSVLSILHRLTGIGLGLGMVVLTWWLAAAAVGADYYAAVVEWLTGWFGRLVILGFTWSLFYHLCNGIRHLFWDAGLGFELTTVTRSGWTVVVASFVLTLVAWIAAYAVA